MKHFTIILVIFVAGIVFLGEAATSTHSAQAQTMGHSAADTSFSGISQDNFQPDTSHCQPE